MHISLIGTGYVGLVSGACFAEMGHNVICVDNDPAKVALIRDGKAPIYEPGLNELLSSNLDSRLTATEDLAFAVEGTEITFIAVGTPFDGTHIDFAFHRSRGNPDWYRS